MPSNKGNGGLTAKQQHALQVAKTSSPGSAKKLRASFVAQNGGATGGARNGGSNSRPKRQRARGTAGVPANVLHSHTTRASAGGQLQRAAWRVNPATSNMVAPEGHGYYDAFTTFSGSAMTHLSIGPATPIVAKTTCSFDSGDSIRTDYSVGGGADRSAQMLIIGPNSSDTQAMLYRVSSCNSQDQIQSHTFNSTQMKGSDADLMETIPTRCSVRVRNFTNALNVGGIVRVLRATTGMHLDREYTSNEELQDIMTGVRDHRRTVSYTGNEFVHAMQKNCIVADQSRSLLFAENNVTPVAGQLPWFTSYYANKKLPYRNDTGPVEERYTFDINKSVDDFTCYLANPTFSPIVIIFEPFGDETRANTYECVVQSQFLAHYRQGSMLANLAIQPVSNHSFLEKARNHEEKKGSMMHTVGKFMYDHRAEIFNTLSSIGQAVKYL